MLHELIYQLNFSGYRITKTFQANVTHKQLFGSLSAQGEHYCNSGL